MCGENEPDSVTDRIQHTFHGVLGGRGTAHQKRDTVFANSAQEIVQNLAENVGKYFYEKW